jgi:anti-sigma-K factor RskA
VNVQEYIESGIIESYVMGLASESERAEFERYCAQYPELIVARRKFEEKLEAYASENAVLPPPEVKVKVLEALRMEKPKTNPKSLRSPVMLKFLVAASILLLVAMGYVYYQTRQENKDLSNANERLRDKVTETDNLMKQLIGETKAISDSNTLVVNMVGTKVAPKSSANVYWDSASTNVYLVVRNMPVLPTDKQYQLWALIDGKPKDLGVFDATNEKIILKMKNTQKAQAFAITIEKKGGSPSPTLDSMQSLGKAMVTQ